MVHVKSGNNGWCPFCTHHMMFHGLSKLDSPNERINCLFDEYVGEKLLSNVRKNGDMNRVIIGMIWFVGWEEYLHDRIVVVDDEPL